MVYHVDLWLERVRMLYSATDLLMDSLELFEDLSGLVRFEIIFWDLVLRSTKVTIICRLLRVDIRPVKEPVVDGESLHGIAKVRVWTSPLKEEDQLGLVEPNVMTILERFLYRFAEHLTKIVVFLIWSRRDFWQSGARTAFLNIWASLRCIVRRILNYGLSWLLLRSAHVIRRSHELKWIFIAWNSNIPVLDILSHQALRAVINRIINVAFEHCSELCRSQSGRIFKSFYVWNLSMVCEHFLSTAILAWRPQIDLVVIVYVTIEVLRSTLSC